MSLKPRARYFAELSRTRREDRVRIAEEAAKPQPMRFRALLWQAQDFAQAPHMMSLDDDALMELQGSRCYLCLCRMHAKPTREHVWPKTHGGLLPGNKLLAHKSCNMKKGDRRPTACELLYRDVLYEIAATPKHVRRIAA